MLCFLRFHQAHCKTSNKEQRNGSTRGCQLLSSLLQMVFCSCKRNGVCSCRNYWQLLFSMVFPPGSGSPAVSSQYPAIIWQWPCSAVPDGKQCILQMSFQNVWSLCLHQEERDCTYSDCKLTASCVHLVFFIPTLRLHSMCVDANITVQRS